MTREEFIAEYAVDAFYWIANEQQSKNIQHILIDVGLKCHTGKGIIGWHECFKNLCTFAPDQFHDFPYFQKTDMWHPNARYGDPVNYEKFINDYASLTPQKDKSI